MSRKTLSELVNQKAALSPEMALRIAKATNTSPESWLNMQRKLNLWNALQHEPENVSEFSYQLAGEIQNVFAKAPRPGCALPDFLQRLLP